MVRDDNGKLVAVGGPRTPSGMHPTVREEAPPPAQSSRAKEQALRMAAIEYTPANTPARLATGTHKAVRPRTGSHPAATTTKTPTGDQPAASGPATGKHPAASAASRTPTGEQHKPKSRTDRELASLYRAAVNEVVGGPKKKK
jgi:hypothetical protein